MSFIFPAIFYLAMGCLILNLFLCLVDVLFLLKNAPHIHAERFTPKILSLGDANDVRILVQNNSNTAFQLAIIDEVPLQFQKRDFLLDLLLPKHNKKEVIYQLTPSTRGEYEFGNTLLFMSSPIGFAQYRLVFKQAATVPVYPSIIQMKHFEMMSFRKIAREVGGMKKIRRIGHSYEFEQIKSYVRGDDYRSINWKASSRTAELMVNQYEDEKSQQIYCIVDKSRNMTMPFNCMSLMDYAINASLVISNIALKKYDKAGLLTFSDIIGTSIKAERSPAQLNVLLQSLYREKERDLESNYEIMYRAVRNLVKNRSLLFLFTNFESNYALERALPILRRINNLHLLVVVFFQNTEIIDLTQREVSDLEGIYLQTTAQKFISEKEQMLQKLKQYGIQALLTKPEELSMNSINKYLELKSRGLI